MGKEIVFSMVKGFGNNKKLKKDGEGYFLVTLGAVNAYNSGNGFYLEDGVRELATNDSHTLARRLKGGYLKGEVSHPQYQTGMTKAAFYARNLRIDQTRVSHHIREIIFVPTGEYDTAPDGTKVEIIRIDGWVKPTGVYGDALLKDLEDENINVAFSVRSFTDDTKVNGYMVKKLLQIVTWDWVVEPGIPRANKFNKLSTESISLESNDQFTFSIDEIVTGGEEITECYNCSLESADERAMTMELAEAYNEHGKFEKLSEW